ncbi:peptidoglycan recognition protein family protein [Streptococcus hyovaginalis]
MPVSKYYRKKKKRRQLVLIGIFLLILLAGFNLYQHYAMQLLTYPTNQTAYVTLDQDLRDQRFQATQNPLEASKTVAISGYREHFIKGKSRLFAEITVADETYYLPASEVTIIQDNPINQAIADLNYPKIPTSQDKKDFRQLPYATINQKPKGIIIHETGNDGSTLDDEITYMVNNYRQSGVFVHSFIDADRVVAIADTNKMAQGAGPQANPYFLQFEMTREADPNRFLRQLANAAYYTAQELHHYHLPVTVGQEDGQGTIWTHDMVSRYLGGTDHTDPVDYWTSMANYYWGVDYTVDDFTQLVQTYYNQL